MLLIHAEPLGRDGRRPLRSRDIDRRLELGDPRRGAPQARALARVLHEAVPLDVRDGLRASGEGERRGRGCADQEVKPGSGLVHGGCFGASSLLRQAKLQLRPQDVDPRPLAQVPGLRRGGDQGGGKSHVLVGHGDPLFGGGQPEPGRPRLRSDSQPSRVEIQRGGGQRLSRCPGRGRQSGVVKGLGQHDVEVELAFVGPQRRGLQPGAGPGSGRGGQRAGPRHFGFGGDRLGTVGQGGGHGVFNRQRQRRGLRRQGYGGQDDDDQTAEANSHAALQGDAGPAARAGTGRGDAGRHGPVGPGVRPVASAPAGD